MFCSWPEDVHVVWTLSSNYFFHFFFLQLFNLAIFGISGAMSMYFGRATPPMILFPITFKLLQRVFNVFQHVLYKLCQNKCTKPVMVVIKVFPDKILIFH